MPLITRLFVKTALIYFMAALLVGLTLAAHGVFNLPPFVLALSPVYFHLLMVGWVTELIIGVAYWMFPKFTRAQPRGSDGLAWVTYALLNGGIILRIIAEPMHATWNGITWGWLLAASALFQWLAGLAFVANTWPRVKER